MDTIDSDLRQIILEGYSTIYVESIKEKLFPMALALGLTFGAHNYKSGEMSPQTIQRQVSEKLQKYSDVSKLPPYLVAQAIQVAVQFKVDPKLVLAVIRQESQGKIRARSGKGAMGLMQVMEPTAISLGYSSEDRNDPIKSIEMGTKYLADMLKRFKGDETLALAAYNAGPGNVRKYGGVPPFDETKGYITKVLGYKKQM